VGGCGFALDLFHFKAAHSECFPLLSILSKKSQRVGKYHVKFSSTIPYDSNYPSPTPTGVRLKWTVKDPVNTLLSRFVRYSIEIQ